MRIRVSRASGWLCMRVPGACAGAGTMMSVRPPRSVWPTRRLPRTLDVQSGSDTIATEPGGMSEYSAAFTTFNDLGR